VVATTAFLSGRTRPFVQVAPVVQLPLRHGRLDSADRRNHYRPADSTAFAPRHRCWQTPLVAGDPAGAQRVPVNGWSFVSADRWTPREITAKFPQFVLFSY
jgi:hypothetical protein